MSENQGLPPGYQASTGYQPKPSYAPQQGLTGPGYGTQQFSNAIVTQPQQQTIVVGNCPKCRVGNVSENFTALGIVLAILFFPIGILCCLLLVEKRCDRCGTVF